MHVLLSNLVDDRAEFHTVQGLLAASVQIFALCKPDSPAHRWCKEAGIEHQTITFRHRLDKKAIQIYRQVLHEHSFDIIHCLSNRALSTALWATRQQDKHVPIVAYRGTVGHLSRWDPASWLSYLHPRLHNIVCVSQAVRDYLHALGIPEERLQVIWKGHDPAWYQAAPRNALTDLAIPEDAFVAGFAGNIRPVKGVRYLLEAFSQITPTEKIHLVIAGEVRDPQIRPLVGKHPNVHFLGYRPDATSLMGACDVMVMPSTEREGLPKAVLEAMAQGVPPITTNVGGLPELIEDGKSGYLVPPKDAKALLHAIRKLAADPQHRKQMGIAAAKRIQGPFHISHTVEKTLALYHRILENHTSAR